MGSSNLIKEYLLKGWEFYKTNLADGINHINRITFTITANPNTSAAVMVTIFYSLVKVGFVKLPTFK